MSYLGQEWMEEEELVPLAVNGNGNGNGTPWYQTAWGGIKDIIKTGTEAFAKVAPYIFEVEAGITRPITGPTTQILTDPLTGNKTEVIYTPLAPGQPIQPGLTVVTLPSGQTVTRTVKKAGVMPPWAWPVALGIGGVLLMNMMGKKKRRR